MRKIHPEGSLDYYMFTNRVIYILTRKVLYVILKKAVKIQINETNNHYFFSHFIASSGRNSVWNSAFVARYQSLSFLWWDSAGAATPLLDRSRGVARENKYHNRVSWELVKSFWYVDTVYVQSKDCDICFKMSVTESQRHIVMKAFQTPSLVNQLLWQFSPSFSSWSPSSPSPLSSLPCALPSSSQSRQRCSRRSTCTWNSACKDGWYDLWGLGLVWGTIRLLSWASGIRKGKWCHILGRKRFWKF